MKISWNVGFPAALEEQKTLVYIAIAITIGILACRAFRFTSRDQTQATAASYLGQRLRLRKEVEKNPSLENVLIKHTELLIKNRKITGGFYWTIQKDKHIVHLIGACPARMTIVEVDEELRREPHQKIAQMLLPSEIFDSIRTCDVLYLDSHPKKTTLPPAIDLPKKWEGATKVPPLNTRTSIENLAEKICGDGNKSVVKINTDQQKIRIEDERMQLMSKHPDYWSMKNELALEIFDATMFQNWESVQELIAQVPKDIYRATYHETNCKVFNSMKEELQLGRNALFILGVGHCSELIEFATSEGMRVTRVALTNPTV